MFQNNSGQNLAGAHLKLNQGGSGDVVLSWDITHNNANRRWYAGIDTSDGYSWKLANPLTTLSYGSENFDNPNETKFKVSSDGSATILKDLTLGGSSLVGLTTSSFNLLNTNVDTVNAFGQARTIVMGSSADGSTYAILGVTESTDKNTGALQVRGGVGIAKNLNIGGNFNASGSATIGDTLTVSKATAINDNIQSTSKTTGALVVAGGAGFGGNIFGGGTLSIASNSSIGGTLSVSGGTILSSTLSVSGATAIDNSMTVSGISSFTNTTQSTSCTTGAVVISGGLGVQKDIYTCGKIYGPSGEIGQIAERIKTVGINTNATYYLTFVDSNNPSPIDEYVYTDSGIYYNPSTNNFSVTGDITAFASDDRLKTNVNSIENALDKVVSLNGFTYNFNSIGETLGFDSSITHVGVSAQQVQKVLPEAVAPAPANEDYLTVKYEKLVPLLIEAIKQLKSEIEELKSK